MNNNTNATNYGDIDNKETGFWTYWLRKADTMRDQIGAWDILGYFDDWSEIKDRGEIK